MMSAEEPGASEETWVSLQPGKGETLRSALHRTLVEAIRSGALRPGVRLPASRRLAEHLGVSRGVVTDAFAQLEAQGFVSISRGTPPVVTAQPPPARPRGEAPPKPPPLYDFSAMTPDVGLFPVRHWLRAMEHAARTMSIGALDYGPSGGEPALRLALADHLGRTRGVIAEPDQIVIVQGTAHASDLILRLLKADGATTIAVEDPSHQMQRDRVRAHDLKLRSQPVDTEGMIVDSNLAADAVIVTPAHQFPTGSVLSSERRSRLLQWSRERGAIVVEDDYDAEFRYDREPVRALQGLDSERVFQVGTVSKTLAPALRLGWIVSPKHLARRLEETRRLVDDFSPTLNQLALAQFLTSGAYDRAVRNARRAYGRRRARVIRALVDHLPTLAVDGIAAGVHFTLRLPPGVSDRAIAEEAARSRIRITPLSDFAIHDRSQNGLVLGYGRIHETAVESAIAALARVIEAA